MLVTKEQISLLKLYQDVSAMDIADVLVEVERRGKNLVLTPEIAALLSMDSAGRLRPIINTSGKVLSTEDSAVDIRAYNLTTSTATDAVARDRTEPCVSARPELAALPSYYKRKMVVPLLTDGGGAYAAATFLTSAGAYYPVIDSILFVSPAADVNTVFTFSVTGGALVGQAAYTVNLVADTINRQLEDVLMYDLTDASTFEVAIAGGPATTTITMIVYYHFET